MFDLHLQHVDGDGCCGCHAAASLHGMDTRALVIEMLTFVRHHPEKLLNPESNYTPGNLKLIAARLEGVVMSLDDKIGP